LRYTKNIVTCSKCGGAIRHKTGFVHINNWSGNWFEVDVAGAGFLLMRRRVFEEMEFPYFHWEKPEAMSEDFYMFCKAREMGYKVWCYSDVKLSHIGELVVETTGKIRVPSV